MNSYVLVLTVTISACFHQLSAGVLHHEGQIQIGGEGLGLGGFLGGGHGDSGKYHYEKSSSFSIGGRGGGYHSSGGSYGSHSGLSGGFGLAHQHRHGHTDADCTSNEEGVYSHYSTSGNLGGYGSHSHAVGAGLDAGNFSGSSLHTHGENSVGQKLVETDFENLMSGSNSHGLQGSFSNGLSGGFGSPTSGHSVDYGSQGRSIFDGNIIHSSGSSLQGGSLGHHTVTGSHSHSRNIGAEGRHELYSNKISGQASISGISGHEINGQQTVSDELDDLGQQTVEIDGQQTESNENQFMRQSQHFIETALSSGLSLQGGSTGQLIGTSSTSSNRNTGVDRGSDKISGQTSISGKSDHGIGGQQTISDDIDLGQQIVDIDVQQEGQEHEQLTQKPVRINYIPLQGGPSGHLTITGGTSSSRNVGTGGLNRIIGHTTISGKSELGIGGQQTISDDVDLGQQEIDGQQTVSEEVGFSQVNEKVIGIDHSSGSSQQGGSPGHLVITGSSASRNTGTAGLNRVTVGKLDHGIGGQQTISDDDDLGQQIVEIDGQQTVSDEVDEINLPSSSPQHGSSSAHLMITGSSSSRHTGTGSLNKVITGNQGFEIGGQQTTSDDDDLDQQVVEIDGQQTVSEEEFDKLTQKPAGTYHTFSSSHSRNTATNGGQYGSHSNGKAVQTGIYGKSNLEFGGQQVESKFDQYGQQSVEIDGQQTVSDTNELGQESVEINPLHSRRVPSGHLTVTSSASHFITTGTSGGNHGSPSNKLFGQTGRTVDEFGGQERESSELEFDGLGQQSIDFDGQKTISEKLELEKLAQDVVGNGHSSHISHYGGSTGHLTVTGSTAHSASTGTNGGYYGSHSNGLAGQSIISGKQSRGMYGHQTSDDLGQQIVEIDGQQTVSDELEFSRPKDTHHTGNLYGETQNQIQSGSTKLIGLPLSTTTSGSYGHRSIDSSGKAAHSTFSSSSSFSQTREVSRSSGGSGLLSLNGNKGIGDSDSRVFGLSSSSSRGLATEKAPGAETQGQVAIDLSDEYENKQHSSSFGLSTDIDSKIEGAFGQSQLGLGGDHTSSLDSSSSGSKIFTVGHSNKITGTGVSGTYGTNYGTSGGISGEPQVELIGGSSASHHVTNSDNGAKVFGVDYSHSGTGSIDGSLGGQRRIEKKYETKVISSSPGGSGYDTGLLQGFLQTERQNSAGYGTGTIDVEHSSNAEGGILHNILGGSNQHGGLSLSHSHHSGGGPLHSGLSGDTGLGRHHSGGFAGQVNIDHSRQSEGGVLHNILHGGASNQHSAGFNSEISTSHSRGGILHGGSSHSGSAGLYGSHSTHMGSGTSGLYGGEEGVLSTHGRSLISGISGGHSSSLSGSSGGYGSHFSGLGVSGGFEHEHQGLPETKHGHQSSFKFEAKV